MLNAKKYTTLTVLRAAALAMIATLVISVPPAGAYVGMLISTDLGLLGTGNWIETGPTSIEWEVTQNPDNTWHYWYVFSHPLGETSHFVLETSLNFGPDNIFNTGGDFSSYDIGWQSVGSGNMNMPEDVYGIRFEEAWGLVTTIEFDSDRVPIWSDFYSKNGNAGGFSLNCAWNAGFTDNDTDPLSAPQDGSILNHLLAPDTGITVIPEPTTLLLLGSALAGVVIARRRK